MKCVVLGVLATLLLVGCGNNSNNFVESSGEGNLTESTNDKNHEKVEDMIPDPISWDYEYEGGKIYVDYKNRNSDLYAGFSGGTREFLGIWSTVPLNVEEIKVTFPIESKYTVNVRDLSDSLSFTSWYIDGYVELNTSATTYFPRELYNSYRGMDWKKLEELYWEKGEAKYESEYDKMLNLYWEDFKNITPEKLPTFYFYHVTVTFDVLGFVSETYDTMEIQIGDNSYTFDIGEIRIHTEEVPMKTQINREAMGNHSLNQWGLGLTYPGGEGIEKMDGYAMFHTEKDICLEKIEMQGESGIRVLGAQIFLSKQDFLMGDGEVEMDLYWDLKTPFTIEAGMYVRIDLLLQDPRMVEIEYGAGDLGVITYSVDGETYVRMGVVSLERYSQWNVWMVYAMLENPELDVFSYFDYYRAVDSGQQWRKTFKEYLDEAKK